MLAGADFVCPNIKTQFWKKSLSRQTIARRNECIDDDVGKQLLSILQSITWFSIVFDESTNEKKST